MLQWISSQIQSKKIQTTVKRLVLLMVVFCFVSFVPATPAVAQSIADNNSTLNQGVQIIERPLGLPAYDIRLIIANIIRAALGLLGIVVLVLMLYAGFLWMTAGGNEEQIASSKNILKNATIGLAIILSSYAIVLFVMRLLGIGSLGNGGVNAGLSAPFDENFRGSGSLGTVIKDHYPVRNQKDVPRNTKIIITFRRSVSSTSFINDTNQNGSYGDCVNIGANMVWARDCDHLKSDSSFITITRADSGVTAGPAAAVVNYENGRAFTVVIRPDSNLGSATQKIPYAVRIGKGVRFDDVANNNPSIFSDRPVGRDFYEWQFTSDVIDDSTPPIVVSVFPGNSKTEAKNSVIQIDFSEAIDPTGIQGAFVSSSSYFTINNTIFLKSLDSSVPLGAFQLTNNYHTLEFTPRLQCGQNACGNPIFCLPVCDKPGATCKQDVYEPLLKSGQTFNSNSFEALPYSGIMDLASNALDGNNNGKVNPVSSTLPVFGAPATSTQEQPDNYFWRFNITDKIDATAPYIKQVSPGINADYTDPNQEWSMTFSKRMRVDPMYTIAIDEKPIQPEPLWKVPHVFFNGEDGTTFTKMSHGPFLNATRHYYFPSIDSTIEDIHFNCFYPGVGPVGLEPTTKASLLCDGNTNSQNCCHVTSSTNSAYCCNGTASGVSSSACLQNLKESSS